MKIDIWSDIACPFCYIGKRHLEQALNNFEAKDKVEVQWHSFQLDPTTKPAPGKSLVEELSAKKGWSLAQTEGMMQQVTARAKEAGLTLRMDRTVTANTFDAHRLTHLAAQYQQQDAAEERLFQAYFEKGLDIADHSVLEDIGTSIGLPQAELKEILSTQKLGDAVLQDILMAQQMGVNGVPFFVFNDKYAVSGAQPVTAFKQVLQQVWEEEQPQSTAAGFCSIDGNC
ncbi:Predicted dithiol-disulfide isomerase, DsbA family [Cnuella takakiae]|uniref:Predicted dithiol-disulfide isomerase, DsbA family n=1 Tax=Cnuella takakiae TaxID=1302690 RepID=A0A1M4XXN6_9BACT|nr:DsbA family oxidoreductase [Cnuella takakiae]OLY92982.1 hypothetical protein BUE76_14580 [Cnuella takakiae]SHE98251.1 Predicted dithiol-disulfide isomerase, DsbA family [Cnuella takakiae]